MPTTRTSTPSNSWADPSRFVRFLHVEESCLDLPYTREIIARSGLPYDVLSHKDEPSGISGQYPTNLTQGKQHLLLTRNRGQFFKPCPGTPEYRCCDYQVLNIGMNCPMDCVYCILQAYLSQPWLSFFVNVADLFHELDQSFARDPERFIRIGTGEFTDSMALDRLTGLSSKLVSYMARQPRGVIELKSKSAVIENLKGLDHQGRTVMAWSLNATAIMGREELRTASLDERLAAARQCADWGYKLAFHFDPIIDHPGWREGYRTTIARLFEMVPADQIAWISLGGLRYLPALKSIGTSRFPGSTIFYQEFIEGLDHKPRYFRERRVELYQHIYGLLKERAHDRTCIYFCMESDEIWQSVMGFSLEEQGGLAKMLDQAVRF